MANAPLHVKVPVHLVQSGELPGDMVGAYVGLGILCMELRESRRGDSFVALRSRVALAMDVGHWANARRRLARADCDVVSYRELEGGRVEITLRDFHRDQGWALDSETVAEPADESPSTARAPAVPPPCPRGAASVRGAVRGHQGGTGYSSARNSSTSSESSFLSSSTSTSTRLQKGVTLSRDGQKQPRSPVPARMPPALRDLLVAARWRLHPSAARYVDDAGYLADEWRRFRAHHAAAGTVVRSLEALALDWFRHQATGERAHERLKRDTEQLELPPAPSPVPEQLAPPERRAVRAWLREEYPSLWRERGRLERDALRRARASPPPGDEVDWVQVVQEHVRDQVAQQQAQAGLWPRRARGGGS